jgi:ParB/RepB/Spo0J family partition protein
MQLKDLIVSKSNVREQMPNDESLANLASSIKSHKLISKLLLRPTQDSKFEIIAGQRRYNAMLSLFGEDYELPEEDYILRADLDDEHALLLSICENQQRLDLSPVELNRAALKLNKLGYKDKEIAKLLNVTLFRLKRLYQLSEDFNRMPEEAKTELKKPVEDSKLNDAHWQKIHDLNDVDVIKDVVDYIINKESSPRDVPTIIKAVEKNHEGSSSEGSSDKGTPDEPEAEGPIEYEHKGELVLEEHGNKITLRVKGKGEDADVPYEHYLEYLRHPDKFRCFIKFKMSVKNV